jgi:hypothetical protein
VPPSSPYQGPPYQNPAQHGHPQQGPQYQGLPYQGTPPQQGPAYQAGYPAAYGPPPPVFGYGYGYAGTPQSTTNGLAVAALALGIAGFVFGVTAPVAVGLGIAALVQIKRRNERGTAQAVVGIVSGGLVTLFGAGLLVVLLVIGFNSPDDTYGSPGPTYTPTFSGPTTYVDELIVGECFDDGQIDQEVLRQPCPQAHQAELFAVVTLAPQAWPGEEGIGTVAQAACDKAFLPYVGIAADQSELDSVSWYPEHSAWSSGDRSVSCAAYGPNGDDLTGSVRGTHR